MGKSGVGVETMLQCSFLAEIGKLQPQTIFAKKTPSQTFNEVLNTHLFWLEDSYNSFELKLETQLNQKFAFPLSNK